MLLGFAVPCPPWMTFITATLLGVYAVPPRSLLDIVGGWLNWAGTLLFLGVPIWIAQGLTTVLAVTAG